VGELLRKVPRLNLAGPKPSVAQPMWEKSGQTKISDEVYRNEIQPRLAGMTIPTIMSALNVCASYAADIRRGKRRPHARHWERLARLVAGLN
jgi:hypothetical protein